MVGAVGIENNTNWNFKDLEEMLRSAKALKRNDRESNGILIGPSMAPRFFYATEIPSWCWRVGGRRICFLRNLQKKQIPIASASLEWHSSTFFNKLLEIE